MCRLLLLYILLICSTVYSFSRSQTTQVSSFSNSRKKVAVVLSGGGAKGMAHIGVLKVIERAGIPIDYIVGTSMGSIIGGLYAAGYSPDQLDSLVRHQDWNSLIFDKTPRIEQNITEQEESSKYIYSVSMGERNKSVQLQGAVNGINLDRMFKKLTVGYHHTVNFDSLKVPFACVATNAVNGQEYVFHHGVLSQAMRASMAIPGVFSPVRIDSMLLVDGGLSNNYPADVARQMGADIIIGVMFQNFQATASELKTAPQILNNIVNLATRKKLSDNQALSDIVIHVPTAPYSTASFSAEAIDSLIARGEKAGMARFDSLVILAKKAGSATVVHRASGSVQHFDKEQFHVVKINVIGVSGNEERRICHRCNLKENHDITFDEIELAEKKMIDEMAYLTVTYSLLECPGGYHLVYEVSDRQKLSVGVNARLDNKEIASLLLGVQLRLRGSKIQTLGFTGRIGKRASGQIDYKLNFNRSSRLNSFYRFEYNDINVDHKGERIYNVVYNQHKAGIYYSNDISQNLRYQFGVNFRYFYYRDFLIGNNGAIPQKSEHFFSYNGKLEYDDMDSEDFPKQGKKVTVSYDLHTDNFYGYKGRAPFHALAWQMRRVLSLSRSRFTLTPLLCGRHLIGKKYGFSLSNFIGGTYIGQYVDWQLPFMGITGVEQVNRDNVNLSAELRKGIGSKTYVWVTPGVGVISSEIYSLFRSRYLFGISAGAGMESFCGPLRASIGYCNYTKHVTLFFDFGFHF